MILIKEDLEGVLKEATKFIRKRNLEEDKRAKREDKKVIIRARGKALDCSYEKLGIREEKAKFYKVAQLREK